MKKLLAIICKKVYMHEENYSSFLWEFEVEHGLIENVIVNRCSNRSNEVILEINILNRGNL